MDDTKAEPEIIYTSTQTLPNGTRTKPIQNLPDYLRYVAKKSKAGFDKVHDEIYKIYTNTLDRRSNPENVNMFKGDKTKGRRQKGGGLFWSSSATLTQQSSFTSYIMDNIPDEPEPDVTTTNNCPIPSHPKPFHPKSASFSEASRQHFMPGSPLPDRLSKSFEDSSEFSNDENEYQEPHKWTKDQPKSKTKGEYMPMDNYRESMRAYTITAQTMLTHPNPGAYYASISGNKAKLSPCRTDDDDDETGDYANAPRKPARSVFEPLGPRISNAGKYRSCFVNLKEHIDETKTGILELSTEADYEESDKPNERDNIYVAPGSLRPVYPDYQNVPKALKKNSDVDNDYATTRPMSEENIYQVPTPKLFDTVFPDDDDGIYQVPPQKYAAFPYQGKQGENSKGLEKSTSDPEMRHSNYQVPPAPRRLHTIDVPDEDFYKVPPSMMNWNNTIAGQDYDVPPSKAVFTKKPILGVQLGGVKNTAKPSNTLKGKLKKSEAVTNESDDDEIYDKPPAPVQVLGAKVKEHNVSFADNDNDDIYDKPPAPVQVGTRDTRPKLKKPDAQNSNASAKLDDDNDDIYDKPPPPVHVLSTLDTKANLKNLHAQIKAERARVNDDNDDDNYDKPPAPVHVTIMKKKTTPQTSKKSPPVIQQKPILKRQGLQKRETLSMVKEDTNWHTINMGNENGEQEKTAETSIDPNVVVKREAFYKMTVDELVELLSNCSLTRLAGVCKDNNISGEYFRTITAEQMKEVPFEMNWFYVSKLFKVIDGWRPKYK